VVDNYVVWRIADPEAFYRSFRGDVDRAEQRINDVVKADVREEIGRRTIPEVLTESREEIVQAIADHSRSELSEAGIEVKDVRINRTELPEKTISNVYARMRTERERLARKNRAEGEEEGRRIRAEADREARVTVAEAERDRQILEGEGEARAAAIYAEAYNADPEFYGFVRSLEAYRKTIGEGTTLVLPPDSEFFRALGDPGLGGGVSGGP
jgi:membrane protease subunit HflC